MTLLSPRAGPTGVAEAGKVDHNLGRSRFGLYLPGTKSAVHLGEDVCL